MNRRLLLGAALVLPCRHARAQPLATPVPPAASLTQELGAQLPLRMQLTDSDGRAVRLGDFFNDQRPVLLVLGYYRCPQLCGLLMHGLLEALHDGKVPRRAVRIVRVSIDPQDTPATARVQRDLNLAYADFLQGAQPADARLDLHLLTAAAADSARLARQAGFSYSALTPADALDGPSASARFAHSAAVLVLTPHGRISRYLMGIQFDPSGLREALSQASKGRIGSLSDRIALLCAHFDPQWGRHSAAVMNGIRAGGVLLAAVLAGWCWRRRGTAPGASR